jgi:carboxymethylenebutenolidase
MPKNPNGAGIVLASAVWGINSDICALADGYAAIGYAVAIPNLFWRQEPDHRMEYDLSRMPFVTKLADSGSDAEGLSDLKATKEQLAVRSGAKRFATLGWCYGGRIVGLAAATDMFELCVAMYPTFFEKHVTVAPKVIRPLSLHLPEVERFGTVEDAVERIVHAFANHKLAESFVYPNVNHGFDFAPPHPYSNHAAARLCDQRVILALDRVVVRGEKFK